FNNANDPYGQATLPYQPPLERTNLIQSQQKQTVFLPNTPQAASSQHKTMRSPQASTSRRISKAEALTIVQRCKKWLVAGALVAFGVLTALAMGHTVGTPSSQTTSGTNNQPTNNQTTSASNGSATSSSSDGSFFQQQQGGGYGGYGFGDSSAWQPV